MKERQLMTSQNEERKKDFKKIVLINYDALKNSLVKMKSILKWSTL